MWLDHIAGDYQIVECTIVYLRQRNTNERNVLFCAVEFLANGVQPQPEQDLAAKLPGIDIEANFRIVHMSPTDAVSFYIAFMAGTAVIPLTTQERSLARTPHGAVTGPLIQEPDWPNVVFDYQNRPFWDERNFWKNRPGGIRRHHLFAANVPSLYSNIQDEAHHTLQQFVSLNLGLNIFSRPGFVGSINLILTNPIFREVRERITRTGICEYTLSVIPINLPSSLKLYLTEYRIFGCGQICQADITAATTIIQLPYDPHEIEAQVVCPNRGLIWASPPTTFIRSVQTQVGIVTGQRTVHVERRSERRPGGTYSVPIINQMMNRRIGITHVDGIAIIASEFAAMENAKLALQLKQQWFKENVNEATMFLQGLIGGAIDEVFVYDPYLGLTEIQRFGLANGNLQVPVCMVTSAEYLRSVKDKRKNLKDIKRYLEYVRGLQSAFSIEVRVVSGRRPVIHDRFIQVDKDLYLLGASLNELGTRGTTFIKIPKPEEIELSLDSVWDNAVPIEDFNFENQKTLVGKIINHFWNLL